MAYSSILCRRYSSIIHFNSIKYFDREVPTYALYITYLNFYNLAAVVFLSGTDRVRPKFNLYVKKTIEIFLN